MTDVLNLGAKADNAIALQSDSKTVLNQPGGAIHDFAANLYKKSNDDASSSGLLVKRSDVVMKKAGDSGLAAGEEKGVNELGDNIMKAGASSKACVSDGQGYIVCGPIVGYPPPEVEPKSQEETGIPKSSEIFMEPRQLPEMNPELLNKNSN